MGLEQKVQLGQIAQASSTNTEPPCPFPENEEGGNWLEENPTHSVYNDDAIYKTPKQEVIEYVPTTVASTNLTPEIDSNSKRERTLEFVPEPTQAVNMVVYGFERIATYSLSDGDLLAGLDALPESRKRIIRESAERMFRIFSDAGYLAA